MELVYLWVEDYKNIQKQRFNFSPRFECEFDGETLIIDEKNEDEYIKDFFGEHINVTAIVGENGSGKSSVLIPDESIKVLFDGEVIYIEYSWYDFSLKVDNKTEYLDKMISREDSNYSIYFNWDIIKPIHIDNKPVYEFSNTVNNPNILLSLFKETDNMLDIHSFNIEIIKKIIQFNHDFSFQTFLYKPYNIEVSIDKERVEKLETDDVGKKILDLEIIELNDFYELYYQDYKIYINELLDSKILTLNILDKEDKDFFDLSHGERSVFLTNLLLFDKIKEKNRDVIVYLDEPDLTLHPEWQKKYINELINTFSSWDKKIHFIITSHSPFIISDLPRENIIFLKDGKQVKGTEKEQTFGANIHTLLSDSFFMEDGLMGEFAKQKINEIIAFFDNKNELYKDDQDKLLKIINSIGEAFLKDKLLFMYNEKYPKTDEEKILELEKQIASIKNGQD